MSKYIGETEKTSRDFSTPRGRAEGFRSSSKPPLFGKRTKVKDPHDRYTNLEIGLLLPRMEEHRDATILATNPFGDIDETSRAAPFIAQRSGPPGF